MWGVFSRKGWELGLGLLCRPQAPGVCKCVVTLGSGGGGPGPAVKKPRGAGSEGAEKRGAAEEGVPRVSSGLSFCLCFY